MAEKTLVIRVWLHDGVTGTLEAQRRETTYSPDDAGWDDVEQLQRVKLDVYGRHPAEQAVEIPGGVLAWERVPSRWGFTRVTAVTLEERR